MGKDQWWLAGGFGTLWFSLMVSPYYPTSLSPSLSSLSTESIVGCHTVYALFLAVVFVLAIVLRRRLDTSRLRKLAIAAACAGTAGLASWFVVPQLHDACLPGEILALGLVAFYVAVFLVAWPAMASRLPSSQASFVVGLSFVLFSCVWALLIAAGPAALGFWCVACPLLGLACFARAAAAFSVSAKEPVSESPLSLRALPWGVIVLCAVFICFGTLSVRAFTTMGFGMQNMGYLRPSAQLVTAMVGLLIVGMFALLFAVRGISTSNVVSAVAALALVYMAALLVVTLADPAGVSVLMAKRILVAAEHGAEVLLLMVLVGKTSQRGLSPALVYGLFGLCVCVVPPFVSLDVMYVTGALAALSESPYTAPLAAVGAFCISAAAMALLISYSRNAAARAQVQGEDWQMELCRAAASGCEMTPRELDVMVYAYRGYSARKIAETLLVSESTVKAHLSHCYRKLGIHSKQELISLIDSYKER